MNKTTTPSVGIASRDHSPSLPKKIFSSIAHGKIGNFLGKWVLCGVRNTPTQRKSVQEEISRFDQFQEEINHFDELPVEIGLKIFGNLPDKDKNNFYHLNKSNNNLAESFYEVKQPVNKATGDPFIEHTIQDGTLADGLLIKYINHHPQEVNSRSLHLAIEYKKWAIAEVLIKHGAELDVDDVITSFCSAVDNGKLDIAEALVKNKNGGEADNILENLAMRNEKNAVIFLLNKKSHLNIGTLLNRMFLYGERFKYKDFDYEVEDSDYPTTHYNEIRSYDDFFAITKALLEKGADVNARDAHGKTLLEYAIKIDLPEGSLESKYSLYPRRKIDLVQFLLQKNADPNTGALLHHAVATHNKEVVALLIHYGANIELQNSEGKTVSELARDSFGMEWIFKDPMNIERLRKKEANSIEVLKKIEKKYLSSLTRRALANGDID